MKYLFWLIEAINWLLYGAMTNIDFKVVERSEYETQDTEWDSCFHSIGSSNSGDKIWVPSQGFSPWFPMFLRNTHYLCYRRRR